MNKKCTKCTKIKELKEFYSEKRVKDGKRSVCKKCHIQNVDSYQATVGLMKRKIRLRTRYLINKGKLKRKHCEVCGNKETQAHHDNYNDIYNVRFLCQKHHTEHHNLTNR